QHDQRERCGHEPGAARRQDWRSFGPRDQSLRMRLAPYILAEHCYVLPEIQLWPQLFDSGLPPDHDIGRGRCQQPAGERVLSASCSRRRKQLKQAAFTEQVEVFGIRMGRISETLARLAGTGPAVFDSRDSSIVVANGPPREIASANDPLMQDDQSHEYGPRRCEPPSGQMASN